MTKWICNACQTSPCYVENESCCIGTPTGCPYRLAPNNYWKPEWKRDCTEEKPLEYCGDGASAFRDHSRILKEQEKKIQELIAAGQADYSRTLALEGRILVLERQVKALHSHRHETMVAHYER